MATTELKDREYARLGLKLTKTGTPERPIFLGFNAAVYDIDTGRILPVENCTVNIRPDSLVTVSLTLTPDDVEVIDETHD